MSPADGPPVFPVSISIGNLGSIVTAEMPMIGLPSSHSCSGNSNSKKSPSRCTRTDTGSPASFDSSSTRMSSATVIGVPSTSTMMSSICRNSAAGAPSTRSTTPTPSDSIGGISIPNAPCAARIACSLDRSIELRLRRRYSSSVSSSERNSSRAQRSTVGSRPAAIASYTLTPLIPWIDTVR